MEERKYHHNMEWLDEMPLKGFKRCLVELEQDSEDAKIDYFGKWKPNRDKRQYLL